MDVPVDDSSLVQEDEAHSDLCGVEPATTTTAEPTGTASTAVWKDQTQGPGTARVLVVGCGVVVRLTQPEAP